MGRSYKIDFLRFVGLAMIIFAHVGPPRLFFQIRNFDVPLMVLVSGMSFRLSSRDEPYLQYLWKRVKRLLFPVWIFLTIYFISLYLLRPSAEDLSLHTILTSFFLISGIGYVWIIRVFILVAIIAPIIHSISNDTKSHHNYLIKLLFVFIIYEFVRYLSRAYITDGLGKYFSLLFFYMIPYSILFAFGLRIPQISSKMNLKLFLSFMLCFLCMAIYFLYVVGSFVPTQNYKYPPSSYYLSYAIAVSIFLWLISDKIWKAIEPIKIIRNFILFVARNSIWIYLWHIPLVKTIHMNFAIKYILVFSISTCIVFVQIWYVRTVLITNVSSQKLKNNLKLVLIG